MDWLHTFFASLFAGVALFGGSQTLTLDVDGSFLLPTGTSFKIESGEFAIRETTGDWRMVFPAAGAGSATYNARSMIIAGPTTNTATDYLCSTWAFWALDCSTDTTGADLGVQDDLQVGDTITASSTLATNATTTNLSVLSLNAASCDLKSTTDGVFYCGTDASGGASSYDAWTHPVAGQSATTSLMLLNGAASTTLASFNYASSTLYYGAGLANCNTENMLTWTDGRFGCEADTSGGGGGANDFTFSTNFGVITAATSSRVWAQNGLFASSTLRLHKGTTSVEPILFDAGATTTSAVDGELGMTTDVLYTATDAGNRGYIPVRHFIRADATRTFTSNTSEQAIFTTPANGRITLETGLYKFEGLLQVSSMSATSGNGAVDILGAGTAVVGGWSWQATGGDVAANSAGAAHGGSWHQTQQSGTNIVTAGTGTGLTVRVWGTFEVTTAGTVIPSFTMTTAASGVVQIGSYMMFERIGSTDVVEFGQWD